MKKLFPLAVFATIVLFTYFIGAFTFADWTIQSWGAGGRGFFAYAAVSMGILGGFVTYQNQN
jgi:hypothetical protein